VSCTPSDASGKFIIDLDFNNPAFNTCGVDNQTRSKQNVTLGNISGGLRRVQVSAKSSFDEVKFPNSQYTNKEAHEITLQNGGSDYVYSQT